MINKIIKEFIFKIVKFDKNPDKVKLLKIQNELEKRGINEKNVSELIKELSKEQKQKLESLYKDQIKKFELSLQNHKNKIISIRNKFA